MTLETTIYRQLANCVDARITCIARDNHEWSGKHADFLDYLIKQHMPSGCGVDSGTQLDFEKSTGEKLVFNCDYHHMNEHGYYDGWTSHTITVKPSLIHGFTMTIGGRNRNAIKDYLYEIFDVALRTTIDAADEHAKMTA